MQSIFRPRVEARLIHQSRSGFTLLELLIVLAIIAVIAAMVVPRFLAQQQGANIKLSRTAIMHLQSALEYYAVDHDAVMPPGNQEALSLLLKPTDKEGKPMKPYFEKIPRDAWGEQLFYEYPNTKVPDTDRPAIWSSGPNRKNENGEGDDVNNWKDLGK